jgi:thioredoxin 1
MLPSFPKVRHINVEDGKGKPLGRSFRVKLWPTFVFLRDGQVVEQLVRPGPAQIRQALEALASSGGQGQEDQG